AQDVISQTPVVFHHSQLLSPTKYRGSGSEVDKAWADLFHVGPSIITKDEARKLPNATEPPMTAGEETYSILLAVFHDLHCLASLPHLLSPLTNIARMSLYPDHYDSPAIKKVSSVDHLGHCIDMLRQTIQCVSDITPLPLKFVPNENDLLVTYRSDTKRVCRDFDKVKEWASARQATEEFDRVLQETKA
ncbi:hypothetical protein B0H13DRAFT_1612865, partial [Mycena leptocephala]